MVYVSYTIELTKDVVGAVLDSVGDEAILRFLIVLRDRSAL